MALAFWSIYIWTLATPGLRDRNGNLKGTDFLHFYTIGSLALEHRGADLYDFNAQSALASRRVDEATGIRYLPLYPPQVALFFAPLARLSYARALAIWWFLNAGLYAACCLSLLRTCPNLRRFGSTVFLAAVAFPAFFHLIAWGQTSGIALACFTAFTLLLRQRRDFLAGLALGCLVFKPQLGLAAAILFFLLGSWRIILGAILSALAEFCAAFLYFGLDPLRTWIRTLWNVRAVEQLLEPRPYQTHCLRTFWSMLIPSSSLSFGLYAVSAVVVIAWTCLVWKRSQDWALRISALLLATVLVSPHLTVYDLTILVPAFLLLADWLLGQPHSRAVGLIGTVLYLVYMLPLAGPLSKWTHVQLSVIAMTFLAYQIWKCSPTQASQQPTIPVDSGVARIGK